MKRYKWIKVPDGYRRVKKWERMEYGDRWYNEREGRWLEVLPMDIGKEFIWDVMMVRVEVNDSVLEGSF